MDLSPGSSSGPERAFTGWMVSVFIGDSILAWGDLECGSSAPAFAELRAPPKRKYCGKAQSQKRWQSHRTPKGLYGGTVFSRNRGRISGERYGGEASYY